MGKVSFVRSNKIGVNKSEQFSNLFSLINFPADPVGPFQIKDFNADVPELIFPSFYLNKSSPSLPKKIRFDLEGKFVLFYANINGVIYTVNSIKKIIITNIFIKNLKVYLFFGLPNLEEVILPDQLESIEAPTFLDCPKLKKITIGSKLNLSSGVGARLLKNKSGTAKGYCPIEDLIINPLNSSAYFDKSRKLLISKDNKKLLAYFNIASGSPSTYTIPNEFQELGDYCFDSNDKLTNITIPATISKLGIGCFQSTVVTTLTLPNTIIDIPGFFLSLNENISTLTIPASVTSIERTAFRFCNNLTSVYLLGNAPTIVGGTSFIQITSNLTFYVCSSATGYGSTYGGRPVVTVTC